MANFVNVSNHFSYVFHLFHSHGSGNFEFASDINSRDNVLVLIPIEHITGHVQQIMHLIRNCHFIMRSVDMLRQWQMYLPKGLFRQPLLNNFWLFLTKLLQLLDGFLAFLWVTRLVVNALELIHFGSKHNNTKKRECRSLDISFS